MVDIEALKKELHGCLCEWMAGKEDNYYKGRVAAASNIFTAEEVATAQYIYANYSKPTRILEIGCGFGQLAILLSRLGYRVIAVDATRQRFDGARALVAAMRAPVDLRFGSYPTGLRVPASDFDLIVTGNVASDFWKLWMAPEEEKYRQFLQGKPIILDARVWWGVWTPEEQREKVIHLLERLGYISEHVMGSVWAFNVGLPMVSKDLHYVHTATEPGR